MLVFVNFVVVRVVCLFVWCLVLLYLFCGCAFTLEVWGGGGGLNPHPFLPLSLLAPKEQFLMLDFDMTDRHGCLRFVRPQLMFHFQVDLPAGLHWLRVTLRLDYISS